MGVMISVNTASQLLAILRNGAFVFRQNKKNYAIRTYRIVYSNMCFNILCWGLRALYAIIMSHILFSSS